MNFLVELGSNKLLLFVFSGTYLIKKGWNLSTLPALLAYLEPGTQA